jgi:hypothetical protein
MKKQVLLIMLFFLVSFPLLAQGSEIKGKV